jgi:hypothetical protein
MLAKFPDKRTGRKPDTRELMYRVTVSCDLISAKNAVEIVRLFHGAQEWPQPGLRGSSVTVVVMLFAFPHRNHAAMRHFALHVLELDRRMVDVETVVQAVFHVAQDALAD